MPAEAGEPAPAGVRIIAIIFALCGIYLGVIGLLLLFFPGLVSMTAGSPLLFGLELAGPYMFLLMAPVGGGVAWGLIRLNNITRHVAMLIAITGVVMLVPPVSAAATLIQPRALVFGGTGIIIRVIIAWYLAQGHIAKEFRK